MLYNFEHLDSFDNAKWRRKLETFILSPVLSFIYHILSTDRPLTLTAHHHLLITPPHTKETLKFYIIKIGGESG